MMLPNCEAPMTGNQIFRLSDVLAQATLKQIVLYFYPKDNTPGCTIESENFRDAHPQFMDCHTPIFGVSRDILRSHEHFKHTFNLPFELIADTDETLCQLFDVMAIKNMYGKKVRGIVRSTFIINRERHIVKAWRGVKVPGHVQEVLAFVKLL